jgi:ribonuclease R
MKRAGYSPVNKGHYGLALGTYGHFTSPIRRYPDLILHRQLDTYMLRGDGAGETHDYSYYETLGDAVSDREIVTDTAERESIKMKAAEFMHDKLGEEYDGTVTGIMPIGFFVGLDRYFVEGLVHVSTLVNDYYTIDKAGVSLVGRATGQRFMLGDRVRVIVTAADKDRGEIDFMVVQELKKRTSRSGQKTSGRGKRKRR